MKIPGIPIPLTTLEIIYIVNELSKPVNFFSPKIRVLIAEISKEMKITNRLFTIYIILATIGQNIK